MGIIGKGYFYLHGIYCACKLQKRKIDRGFTFVETLAVLAITLILSAGIGLSAVKYIEKAKVVSVKNQLEVYKMALQSYYLDCGVFPTELQGLNSLWEKPLLSPIPNSWNGPYVDRVISTDPWGNAFKYSTSTTNGLPFLIMSFGSDGKEGGNGVDADIVSWK